MARKIIFKGKRVDNGEWVEGNYLESVNVLDGQSKPLIQVFTQEPSNADRFTPVFGYEFIEVDPNTLSQYTENDYYNGYPVYEGDIFSIGEFNVKVFFCPMSGWLVEGGFLSGDSLHMYLDTGKKVGNIYDNPELLEV